MRAWLVALLLASSTAAAAAPVDEFLAAFDPVPADAAAIDAHCDRYIAEIERRLGELEGERGRATVARTLQRFDDLTNVIGAAGGDATLYREVAPDAARRNAGGACEVRVATVASRVSLSRPVYDRLKAIDASRADPATRLYLARTLAAFERAGVARDAAGRAEIQAMQEELARLGTKFDQNIANGARTVDADPAELLGLPADYIARHPPGANGKVTITTATPDYVPVMAYSHSEPLRRRMLAAYLTRAYPANEAPLRRMLDLRHTLARTLGRPDYASLVLEDKMLKTPARVEALLGEMAAAALPAARADYAKKLAAWHAEQPGATRIEAWNNAYLTNKVQKQAYAYDRQEARRYFAYDNVRDGILRLTEDVFGVEIRRWQTAAWDPLVESYEMVDDGKLVGRFYFDSHPRDGKYSHANAIGLRSGIAGRSLPMGALVMNFPAGGHATGLMEHSEVVTFLHEFGHLLHAMFGGGTARWAGQSGVATEWDFVEAPSQMLENWVYDYDTLARFAVDERGETIPRELVEKMSRSRYFDLGMGDMRQLALSNISLAFHRGPAPADLGAAYHANDARFNLIALPPTTQPQDSFNHLNGYSAIYYTYRWSKVIADDLFTRFRANGLRDTATAERYRRLVLEPGGTKPAAELVADFLGRPITLDAYRAELAKAAQGQATPAP